MDHRAFKVLLERYNGINTYATKAKSKMGTWSRATVNWIAALFNDATAVNNSSV
jgi:hypothetical protein